MQTVQSYHHIVRSDVFGLIPQMAGKVLDFGGGVGATSAALKQANRADSAVLFDQVACNSLDSIDAAETVDLEDLAVVQQLLEKHGRFDTILCLDVLEHLRDPWSTAAMLARALVPGGCMIISLPNVNYIGLVGPLVFKGRFEYTDAGILYRTHLRWFAKHGMIELARQAGLQVVQIEPNCHGRLKRWLNGCTFGVFERFLAMQFKLRAISTERE